MHHLNNPKILSQSNNHLHIDAPAGTNYFIDMNSGRNDDTAPFCYEKRRGDFIIRAKVKAYLQNVYDAAALFVLDSDDKWIKFAFEQTDLGYPSVVAVVTDGVSDDSNGETQAGNDTVWLQIARKGNNWVLHYSKTGKEWKMVRYFQLKMNEEVSTGFLAQSPLGDKCIAEFSDITICDYNLQDMRKGV